jgi:sulfite reductase (ferredoxin)
VRERGKGESFQAFVQRIGKAEIKALLDDLTVPPTEGEARSFFTDWADPREYSIGDIAVGECAGEVVSAVEFGLTASERSVFEAQLELEQGRAAQAGAKALDAMVGAAAALLKTELDDPPGEPEAIVAAFRSRFYDTQKFFDPFAGGKFAHYLFAAIRKNGNGGHSPESAHHLIEEAQLFIEAAHGCYNRMGA